MSRAFVNEDAGQWGNPGRRFDLPERDDPDFDRAAAEAMMEAAAAMGCSEGSVKTHCSRAVHALALTLKAKGLSI